MAANTNFRRYINEEQAKSLVKDIHTFVQGEDSSLAARVEADLKSEVAWRKAADEKLNEKLNKETDLRIADVDNEKNRAIAVEGSLEEAISLSVKLSSSVSQNITGGLDIEGGVKTDTLTVGESAIIDNLTVKDLNVTGTTTTVDQETLAVKDNLIITNSGKETLTTADSGLAINKNATETYGIVYNPNDDSINLGIGSLDENNNFVFNEGEGLPIVVRDSLVNNNFILYSEDGYKVIDSGISKANYEDKVTRLEEAETNITQLGTNLTTETSERQAQDTSLQTQITTNKDNISAEESRAKSVEGNLSFNTGLTHITNLTGAINAENSRAKEVEIDLSTRLDMLESVPDDGRLYVVYWVNDAQNSRILKWTTLDDGELED